MRFIPQIIVGLIAVALAVGVALIWPPSAANPDPNHTHADFTVWIGSMRMNFNRTEWMSGSSLDAVHDNEDGLRKFIHLHDNVDHVVHVHKPGMTIGDFFASLKMEMTSEYLRQDPDHSVINSGTQRWHMYVNEKEMPFDPAYVPRDLDAILLTYVTGDMEVSEQLRQMTHDACLYSKTCPWRGAPPSEGCVADPTVPCRE